MNKKKAKLIAKIATKIFNQSDGQTSKDKIYNSIKKSYKESKGQR